MTLLLQDFLYLAVAVCLLGTPAGGTAAAGAIRKGERLAKRLGCRRRRRDTCRF